MRSKFKGGFKDDGKSFIQSRFEVILYYLDASSRFYLSHELSGYR